MAFAYRVIEVALSETGVASPEIAFVTRVIAPVCPEIGAVPTETQMVVTLEVAFVFPMHFFHLPMDQITVLFHKYLLRHLEPTTFRFGHIRT